VKHNKNTLYSAEVIISSSAYPPFCGHGIKKSIICSLCDQDSRSQFHSVHALLM